MSFFSWTPFFLPSILYVQKLGEFTTKSFLIWKLSTVLNLKDGLHLEICVTLGKKPHLKKGHTSNRVTIEIHWSNFKKVVTRWRIMGRTWNIRSYLEKWVPLKKLVDSYKNGSDLEKNGFTFKTWVTLKKMGHTSKNGSHYETSVTLKERVTLEKLGHTFKKLVTPGEIGHTWKNGLQLEYWVTG